MSLQTNSWPLAKDEFSCLQQMEQSVEKLEVEQQPQIKSEFYGDGLALEAII